ncbi:MAG: hypothetical protein ACFFFK_08520 [Candidatus Thorarchaeota archaeon]
MKTQWMMGLSCLTMLVLFLSVFTGTAEATVVWSDNFDDGNYDGWTILGYNSTTLEPIAGNFSAASGMLTSLDDDVNIARYTSTMTVGTWSFDLFVPDDDNNVGSIDVMFTSNGTRPFPHYSSLTVSFEAWYDQNRFDLWELRGNNQGILLDHFVPAGIEGWWNVIVTRSNVGHYKVYINGTLRMDVVNNDVTGSDYLEFFCWNVTGAAIDNIVVYDEIWPTTTPTTTAPPPDARILLMIVGVGVAVLVIIAIVCLRRK